MLVYTLKCGVPFYTVSENELLITRKKGSLKAFEFVGFGFWKKRDKSNGIKDACIRICTDHYSINPVGEIGVVTIVLNIGWQNNSIQWSREPSPKVP